VEGFFRLWFLFWGFVTLLVPGWEIWSLYRVGSKDNRSGGHINAGRSGKGGEDDLPKGCVDI